MTNRLFNAPLLLLLWQVAPVDFPVDSSGRVRLSLGAGAGSFSYRYGTSCDGSRVRIDDSFGVEGAAAGVWAGDEIRLHAAGGDIQATQSGRCASIC